jgi:hypothetical protein
VRIIFSRDRAAQLDLLLSSLERNAEPEETWVIWRGSSADYRDGYEIVIRERGSLVFRFDNESEGFERSTNLIVGSEGDFVTFLCDDDVLFAPLFAPLLAFGEGDHGTNERLLCLSLRLGTNTTRCYPTGLSNFNSLIGDIGLPWDWRAMQGDFAYPGSLDGHIFRTADVQRILDGRTFRNPTELEDALQAGCLDLAEERPLMACYPRSVLCSVPVNKTSEQSQVRAGERFPVSAAALNERFLDGWRLDLDSLDFSGVDSAHYEVDLEAAWRRA